MGYGNYSHEAHQAIVAGRANASRSEVFTQRSCHPLMNPHGVRLRESRDSAEHPRSLGVVFALDVTGSMGAIPDLIARREMPGFMKIVQACSIPDPQIMFVAVGDAYSDDAPLQVGQFETTAELMDQWLTFSYLEGGGGGQGMESYGLAMYFLAEHTVMDCVEKRNHKGYLFLTGDELPYPTVARAPVQSVIGDMLDSDIPIEAVVAGVQASYHPFFLIPDLQRRQGCERRWRDLLGDQVIAMEGPEDTCYVAAGAMAIGEGVVSSLDQLAALLREAGTSEDRLGPVIRALTPFAASRGVDGAPGPALDPGAVPR